MKSYSDTGQKTTSFTTPRATIATNSEQAFFQWVHQEKQQYFTQHPENIQATVEQYYTKQNVKLRKQASRTPESYKHHYPRTVKTRLRVQKACEYLRKNYKLSINKLAFIINVSTKTVHNHLKNAAKHGFLKWTSALKRSKNSRGIINSKGQTYSWNGLRNLVNAFIQGRIDLLELALGENPP